MGVALVYPPTWPPPVLVALMDVPSKQDTWVNVAKRKEAGSAPFEGLQKEGEAGFNTRKYQKALPNVEQRSGDQAREAALIRPTSARSILKVISRNERGRKRKRKKITGTVMHRASHAMC